jgi:predicted CXXCH cytochrome family protein
VANRIRMALWAVSAGGMLIFCACAASTRYDVLTFFFDGVPPPEGAYVLDVESLQLPDKPRGKFASSEPMDVPAAAIPASVHAPFQKNECRSCHDISKGLQAGSITIQMCDTCHGEQRRESGWDHGPMNLGTCLPCHKAHSSQYPRLLSQPIPDLCVYCHWSEDSEGGTFEHLTEIDAGEKDLNACLDCHDPHRVETGGRS